MVNKGLRFQEATASLLGAFATMALMDLTEQRPLADRFAP